MESNAPSGLPTRGYEGFSGHVGEYTSESTPGWDLPLRARPDAPNVIVMLVDDMGYSDIAPFGGEIDTPGMSSLAADGYTLTNYHTAPLCAPSRAALMTGLNPHRAGVGRVAFADLGYPGYRMHLSPETPTLAECFREAGYATYMVGKWHLTPSHEMHDGGDRSTWPTQRGFDRYFGSLDAFTSLYQPHRLIRDSSPVDTEDLPDDYFLTDGLTEEAIRMIEGLRSGDSSKPFFLYYAHHAVHGPVQAKPTDIEKYRGMYNAGWDRVREERYRRQVEKGIIASDVPVPGRNRGVPPWDELSDEQRERFARYMEVYAAAVDSVDQSLVQITEHLKAIGEYENTIIVVTSDNGGTAEGGDTGTRSYLSRFGRAPGLPADWEPDVPRDLDLVGGPQAWMHYPAGWATVSNTPYRLYKGSTHGGGVRAPLLVSWPAGLPKRPDDSGLRRQFAFVTDLGQTVLELSGVPQLRERHGSSAPEVDGVSLAPALRDASSSPPRTEQYLECAGHRGFIAGDWKLVARHQPGTPFSDDEWELYDLSNDPAETRNLASQRPDHVADLAQRFKGAAWFNTVFPLDDDGSTRRLRSAKERHLSQPVTLRPTMPTLERHRSSRLIQFRSFAIEIEVSLDAGDRGVLVAHGDQGGGYCVAVEEGRIVVDYNEYGEMLQASAEIAPGSRRVEVRFSVLPEFAWSVALVVDGIEVASLPRVRQFFGLAPFTGISVGADRGSPVNWERWKARGPSRFTGRDLVVRYVPGASAPYNPEVIVEAERDAALHFD